MPDKLELMESLTQEIETRRMNRRAMLVRAAALGATAPTMALLTGGLRSAAAQDGTPVEVEDDGETVQLRMISDVVSVDPATIGNTSDHSIAILVYSGLARYKPGGVEVEPDLATSWDISEDGLTYTFHLRQGVKWQKGYGDFTANDVVYTINRIKDPATASQFAQDLEVISAVEAVDDYTVTFTLTEPFSAFLSAIIAFRPGWIVNQQAVEEKGENYPLDPIGTGPYQWDSRAIGTEVVLQRNPDSYQAVDIETVRLKFIQEDSVAELALQSGDLDIGYIFQPEAAERVLSGADSGVTAKQIASYRTQWAGFNLSREKMQDIRVRQAIIHAIDKHAAANGVAGDLAQVVSSIFNPNLPGVIDPDPFPYDPEKASSLLAEAGYTDGIDIDVLVIPSSTWPDLVTILQEQWKQVGINANLITVERAVYDEMMNEATAFDIGTVNITRSEPYQYASYFLSTNIPDPNFHNYNSPEADALVSQASTELDPAVAADLWGQFQTKILVDDVVGFGMTNINYAIAWREGFSGVDSLYVDSFPVWQVTKD